MRRHRRGVGRPGGPRVTLVIRLRLVRWISSRGSGLSCADARRGGTSARAHWRENMIATETAVRQLKFFVNGSWQEARGSSLHPITNPATGEVIAQVPYATAHDVDRTARSAPAAFLAWREVPVDDRVHVLYRSKALLHPHSADIVPILAPD